MPTDANSNEKKKKFQPYKTQLYFAKLDCGFGHTVKLSCSFMEMLIGCSNIFFLNNFC